MAAGSSALRIATSAGSLPEFPCSPFPVSSGNVSFRNVRFPVSLLTTSSSSMLASEMPRRESWAFLKTESAFSSLCLRLEESLGIGKVSGMPRRDSSEFLKMESAFSSLCLRLEESLGVGNVGSLPVRPNTRPPCRILEAASEEDLKDGGGPVSAPLAWRDASLRYANVMWFRGAYNVEIICMEDESEESLVRRFRRKVSEAGVIRECQRRRYLETRQDTIKRKQRMASQARKRRPWITGSSAWTGNAWHLSKDDVKPVDHSKKKKKKKSSGKSFGQSRFGATKNVGSDKKIEEPDNDYWGFVEEEKEGEEASPRRSSH